MSKIKLGRLLLLTIVLATALLLFPNSSGSAVDASPWLSGDISLDKVKDLATGQLPPISILGNRDCQARKIITRPGRLLPIPQAEQSHQGCVVDTGYGAYSQSGYLQRQGTTIAGLSRLSNSIGLNLIPIPGSNTAIRLGAIGVYGDANLIFTQSFSDKISSAADLFGRVSHAVQPDFTAKLKDKSGQLLSAVYDSISFSANGMWMVADVPYIGTISVNTETFEVLPFGDALNYHIGISPGLQTAITSDGRYAVVASRSFATFKLYDLSTCGPVPLHITSKVKCSRVDLWPFMQQRVPGFTGVVRLRFKNNGALELYATSTVSGISKTTQYMLLAGGQQAFGFEYLALGDSYTSGEGAYEYKALTDTSNNRCHLSQRSYPYLLGHDLGLNQYESVACSGAVIEDIVNDTDEYNQRERQAKGKADRSYDNEILDAFLPGHRAQVRFITEYGPRIITVSAVGNDIGFASKLVRCVFGPDTCFSSYEDRLEIVREVNAQFDRLTNMYTQLKSNPLTKVYAIGYPQVAKPDGNCGANVHLNNQELQFTQDLISYLNSIIEQAANNVGVAYVDIGDALYGHRLCESVYSNVAVNGATLGNDKPNLLGLFSGPVGNESYHPNAMGHRLVAQKIKERTSNFTQPMPGPDPNATPPTENSSLPILQPKPTGRPIKKISYDDDLSNDIWYRNGVWNILVQELKFSLNPLKTVRAWLNSDPIDLGTYTTDSQGRLNATVTLPQNVPTGYHTLHLYGQNVAGEDVDIYKTIYVAASEDDLDGDGLPNASDPCTAIGPAGIDADQDGIDDACDGFIDQPPLVLSSSSSEKSQQTYSDPEGSFVGLSGDEPVGQAVAENETQNSTPANQIQPAGSLEPSTSQPQVAGEASQVKDLGITDKPSNEQELAKPESQNLLIFLAILLPGISIAAFILVRLFK